MAEDRISELRRPRAFSASSVHLPYILSRTSVTANLIPSADQNLAESKDAQILKQSGRDLRMWRAESNLSAVGGEVRLESGEKRGVQSYPAAAEDKMPEFRRSRGFSSSYIGIPPISNAHVGESMDNVPPHVLKQKEAERDQPEASTGQSGAGLSMVFSRTNLHNSENRHVALSSPNTSPSSLADASAAVESRNAATDEEQSGGGGGVRVRPSLDLPPSSSLSLDTTTKREYRPRANSAIATSGSGSGSRVGIFHGPPVTETRRRAQSVLLPRSGDSTPRAGTSPAGWVGQMLGEGRNEVATRGTVPSDLLEASPLQRSRKVDDVVVVVDEEMLGSDRSALLTPSDLESAGDTIRRRSSVEDGAAGGIETPLLGSPMPLKQGFVNLYVPLVKMTTSLSTESHWLIMIVLFVILYGSLASYFCWKAQLFLRFSDSVTWSAVVFLCMEVMLSAFPLLDLLDYLKPETEHPELPLIVEGNFPSVVILITCCHEDVEVIKDVVRAALCQEYPCERYAVWVLDDGGDDELQKWCTVYGDKLQSAEPPNVLVVGRRLQYIRRAKVPGVPHHYKAGNLNHALGLPACASYEFVAVLDADMIVSRSFLTTSLAYFTSLNIAFVQSPQGFYNIPPGDPHNDGSLSFYHCTLPRRDAWGAAMCIGTGAIFRRTALEEIGYFSTGTLTEDFDTALHLHARGYDSVYLIQHLQMGLAPWTLTSFIEQRQRWCMGGVQIILKRRILSHFDRRFSLYRRLIYLYSGAKWFQSFPVAFVYVVTVCILAFEWSLIPMEVKEEDMRLYIKLMVPCMLSYRVINYARLWRIPGAMVRAQTRLRDEQWTWWMSPYLCMGILRVMFPFIPKEFEVTGSFVNSRHTGALGALLRNLNLVLYHVIAIAVGLAVVIWKILFLDIHDCGRAMFISNLAFFILFAAQHLAMPVYSVICPPSTGPADRKALLSYDGNMVPRFRVQFPPPTSYSVLLMEVIPFLWSLLWAYYFYVAITPDYQPAFCSTRQFFQAAQVI